MKLIKNFLLASIFVTSSISYAQFTDEVNSNRPGKSMMAFSVGKSIFQTETGINYIKENHQNLKYDAKGYFADIALRWGLFKEELELIAEFQYQKDTYNQLNYSTDRNAFETNSIWCKIPLF